MVLFVETILKVTVPSLHICNQDAFLIIYTDTPIFDLFTIQDPDSNPIPALKSESDYVHYENSCIVQFSLQVPMSL